MNVPATARDRPVETVAGLMASGALFVSFVALVHRPLRIAPVAIAVAIVAAGIGGRHQRLAAFAVAVAAICFVAGMTIAIATESPLY